MHLSTTNGIAILFLTISNLIMHSHAALPIRLLTHNIRYATTSPFTGEKPWADRRPLIINEFKYNTLYNSESFICLQEVLKSQLSDIMSGLGSEWTYIGVGRDDGKTKGEYSPIIYRKGVWELETWKTVWLNEDGSVGKKGWDAGSVRIVTIGHFKHVQSKKRVLGMCTHLDNAGATSRRESAKIILGLVAAESSSNGTVVPFFLGGDFNSEMTGKAYQMLNSKTSPLRDAREMAGWRYGDQYTYTGFGDEKDLIDFVLVGPRGGSDWNVEGYSVLPNRFDDGVFKSDHRAVVVDTVLQI